jgi:structural maintenance of chromosome 1
MALGEHTLDEYRKLKAAASVLAVDERQELETVSREYKTVARTLGQLKEKQTGLEENRETRSKDLEVQTGRKKEVRRVCLLLVYH